MKSWTGVDLDGTLAEYDHWRGVEHIGAPVPAMVERVQHWLSEGRDVRIFTARVCDGQEDRSREDIEGIIRSWCLEHVGAELPITNIKDFGLVELWDDRCVQVERNTGRVVGYSTRGWTP